MPPLDSGHGESNPDDADISDREMRRYYAERAPEYDRVYEKPERQADLAILKARLPEVFRGRRVLEVACGTGYWTQFIAPAVAEMVGIDATPETLRIARARVPSAKVRFAVGDAYRLPVALGRFDTGFAGFWLSHVPIRRRAEFLARLSDLLRPGSWVLLVDNLYVEGSNTPVSKRDEEGDSYQIRTLHDGSVHRVLKNFPSRAELEEAVVGIGRETRYTALGYYWIFEYETVGL